MPSSLTRVRRQPQRGRYDREAIQAVLDSCRVAHVAFVDDGQPICVPMLYARVGQEIYIHGSSASRAMQRLGERLPACVTVTTIDGLVLARSAFEHSANYRSAMLFGSFRPVKDAGTKRAALEAFTEALLPGRWAEVRHPTTHELKATSILAFPIREAAVKARSGPPDDDDSPDAALDTWAGEVPLIAGAGAPRPTPGLRAGIALSTSVRDFLTRNEVES